MKRKQLIHINTNAYAYRKYGKTLPIGESSTTTSTNPLSLSNITDNNPKWYKYGDYYYLKDTRQPIADIEYNNGLNFGEIGISYKKNYEKIYLKNSNNEIVSLGFSDKIKEPIFVNTTLFNDFYKTTFRMGSKSVEEILRDLLSNGPLLDPNSVVFTDEKNYLRSLTFNEKNARNALLVNEKGTGLEFYELGSAAFVSSNTFAPKSHTHTISNITNLQTSLDGKAANVHTHKWADITNAPTSLPANGGNADKLGGLSSKEYVKKLKTTNTVTNLTTAVYSNYIAPGVDPGKVSGDVSIFNFVLGGYEDPDYFFQRQIMTKIGGRLETREVTNSGQGLKFDKWETIAYLSDIIPYQLPTASASVKGGVTIGSGITLSGSKISVSCTSIGAATSDHTHNYAGSLSAGGAATSANKLNTDGGSSIKPVYFTGGKPKECGFTVETSVPKSAVFTDTTYTLSGTKATIKLTPSVGSAMTQTIDYVNHSAYSEVCTGNAATATNVEWSGVLNKPKSFTPSSHTHPYLPLSGGTLTGSLYVPTIYITGNQTTLKNRIISSDDSSNIFFKINDIYSLVINDKVVRRGQSAEHMILGDSNYPWAEIHGTTIYEGGEMLSKIYSPIGHTHSYAGSSSAGGAATSANKLNTDAGTSIKPVYFTGGKPKECGFTVETSVPKNAVFTDHTYNLGSFGITATSAEINKLDGVTASTTEINYLDGVTSNIQTQLNSKSPNHDHPYLKLTGGVVTGSVDVNRTLQNGRIFNNVLVFESSSTPDEIVIFTKIAYKSSNKMPLIHLKGYAYGESSPIEITVAFYIYNDKFTSYGATSTCPWKPYIILSSYKGDNGEKYVALTLSGSIYFPRFQVDYMDIWSGTTRREDDGWYAKCNTTSETGESIMPRENLAEVPYRPIANNIDGNATTATHVAWTGITEKPDTYTPSSHKHTVSDITNFPTSMKANGGNADTLEGHGADYFAKAHSHPYLSIKGGAIQNSNAILNIHSVSASRDYTSIYASDSSGSGTRDLILQEKGGNVGIGIISPKTALHVVGNVTADQFIENGSSLSTIYAQKVHSHSTATTGAAGYMSATDKKKLDGIEAGANKYSLPIANASSRGGVTIGSGISQSGDKISVSCTSIGAATSGHNHDGTYAPKTHSHDYIPNSLKGAKNGVATLDGSGLVPASQLPSFVDDVIEGYENSGIFYTTSAHTVKITPSTGKIYVDLHTNKTFRWSGSVYTEISKSLAIGTTAGTAYDGKAGNDLKIAFDKHTHSYAGSSSAGGAATSANKLNTDAGTSIKPVYFSGGKPVACGFTVETSVPKNAVFTDHTYNLGSFGISATADEINKLDGVTASTTEINKLDGVTASTTEINYLDGVTSNIQTQLNGKAPKHSHPYLGINDDAVGIQSPDYRETEIFPNTYGKGLRTWFVSNAFAEIESKKTYSGIIHFKPYGNKDDHSGGFPTQIALTDNNEMFIRSGVAEKEWGKWIRMANVSDIPTTLPASDVHSWAKAASKPTYTKSEVGLSNVENKSSETIRGELTKKNVTDALGYTPPSINTTYNDVTTTTHGLMTAADKVKLNGIETGANKYILPDATKDKKGGVIIGSGVNVSSGTISVTKSSIGLGNVDNTADNAKSVKYATGAGNVGGYGASSLIKWWGNQSDINKAIQAGFYTCQGTANAPLTYGTYITLPYRVNDKNNSVDFATQLFIGTGDQVKKDFIYYRTSSGSAYGTWRTVLDSTNYDTYASPKGHGHSVATTGANGFMSAADKTKLNGIEANANNYSLPTATSGVKGGVTIGSGISQSGSTISVSCTSIGAATSGHNHDGTYAPKSHSHPYLPLSGGTLSGDLTMMVSNGHNKDQFIKFKYSTTDLDKYSWRLGYLGSGSDVNNSFTIQNNSDGGWNNAMIINLDKVVEFSSNVHAPTFYENGKTLSTLYAPKVHSHSYAGSSSAGGAATSANKLNTDGGSSIKPVYFSGGKPVECGFTIQTSVPKNAVFTDHTYNLGSFGISATAAEINKLDGVTASTTEINYLDGVTSNIQTQLNGKSDYHTHPYVNESGDTMTGELKAHGGISLNSSTTSITNPQFLISIDSFSDGGKMHWSNNTDVTVGSANKLTTTRTLWGQNFNGNANVTGSLSNTGNITPSSTIAYDLGSATLMYNKTYTRYIDTSSGYDLRLCTGGSEKVHVNSSNGNVGIGIVGPSEKLEVNGTAKATAVNIKSKVKMEYNNAEDCLEFIFL